MDIKQIEDMKLEPQFQTSKYSTLKVKKSIQRKLKNIAKKNHSKVEYVTEQFLTKAISDYQQATQ